MKVEIYSDVVCPWCCIGEKRFDKALTAFEGRDDLEVVFRAYQLDPATPARPEPLLAVEAGLPEPRVASFLVSGDGERETKQELEAARALGITAVPTVVFEGKYGVPGAQEPEAFLQVLRQIQRELATS